jgi:galactosylceramidase
VGLLTKGGSYVTRVSPDLRDLSIVVEKMTHDDSNCARGSNPDYSVETEVVTFIFNGSFTHLTSLHVWYSNLTDGNDSKQLFLQLADLPIVNNRATLTVRADELYTLTTLATGSKGSHPIPAPAPLPIPYLQNFDAETIYSPPALWYDQMGAWEVHASGDSSHGNVMRQMVPVWPACWGYSCNGPTTYFGPSTLNVSLNISFAFLAEEDVALSLSLDGAGGPTLTLSTNGTWTFGSSSGSGIHFEANVWHQVQLLAYADKSTAVLDGTVVGSASPTNNGFRLKLALNRYIFANLDNFALQPL